MELEDMFTKMKKIFILCIVMAMCSPDNTNAQSFFKKIKKAVEKEKKALENEISLLNDDDYVARYARENYVFTREGEQVAIIPGVE